MSKKWPLPDGGLRRNPQTIAKQTNQIYYTMHSRIFEISSKPIENNEWAGESTIADENYHIEGADYFGEIDDEEERCEHIEYFFTECFPDKSFKIVSNKPGKTAVVKFVGNIDALYEEWYEYVKDTFNELDKKMGTMDVFRLRLACKEPFGLSSKFYIDEWDGCTDSAESLMEWLRHMSRENEGKPFLFYVGQVFDYHF